MAPDLRQRLGGEIAGLLLYARTVTGDFHLAEDLVQETILRALISEGTFRAESSLTTWLHRILHNLAVDRARRTRETVSEDIVEQVEARWRDSAFTVDAATVIERAERREQLRDALIRLPMIYRSVVILHDMEAMTVAMIADIMGVGLPAAKQRLRRGRMMLIDALAKGAERSAALRAVPLRCWDARYQISDYLDEELTPPDRRRVERHLQICPTCPPLYAALVGVSAAWGTLRDPDTVVPQSLARRIAEADQGDG